MPVVSSLLKERSALRLELQSAQATREVASKCGLLEAKLALAEQTLKEEREALSAELRRATE